MNHRISSILFVLTLVLLSSCKTQQAPFSKKDILSGQKLIGLNFEKQALDTMYRYLDRNRRGYDSLRKYKTDNEVFPALTFDPHPAGFTIGEGVAPQTYSELQNVEMPSNKDELAFYSIRQLSALLASRKISSLELTEFFIDRIKKYDGQLLSVINLTEDLARKQARKADAEIAAGKKRGVLHGIPYGVKDLMAVEGYPTTWGAAPYKNQMIDYTSTVVNKLQEQGAVLIAKLVSGALARGDVWFGGKTKNPWDLSQGASGSSAGSGSATAAGLVPFALGTETLGSIVSPSTRNGVTGLRPTYGQVSRHGVMSLSWSMDKVGPLARTAEDCMIVFEAIQGQDKKDPSTGYANLQPGKQPAQMKVAYLKRDIDRDTSASGNNLRKALTAFRNMGIEPETMVLPGDYPYAVFDIILRAEAGAFFDDLVLSGAVDKMVEQTQGSRANSLRQSRFIPAVEYLQANRQRRRLIEEIHTLFKEYDVIIAPTFGGRQLFITNLTGHPAMSIPTGFDAKGRPTSLTLLGNLYREADLVELAKAYQEQTDFHKQQPPLFSAKQ